MSGEEIERKTISASLIKPDFPYSSFVGENMFQFKLKCRSSNLDPIVICTSQKQKETIEIFSRTLACQ